MRITWFGHLGRMICLGIACVILGLAMLALAFCIPVNTMARHVGASVDGMLGGASETEGGWMRRFLEDRETYTDAIMVQNAIEEIDGKSAYEHAMWAYHLDLREGAWDPEASLRYLSNGGDKSVMYLHQYSRYWHGYLVYLKPLLLAFTWEQIVWIGAGLQIFLTAVILFMAARTGNSGVGVVLLVGLAFMKPVLMYVSLAMAVCWVVTLGVTLLILSGHRKIEQKDAYPELFCLTGIMVAYFDFLTYPIVTLGFPLCVYFMVKKEESLKENVVKTLAYSVCWGLGYVGMWGMKWAIADITLGTGTMKSAFSSILGWTESIGGRPRFSGAVYTIFLNLQKYDSWLYLAMTVLLLAADAVAFFYACRKASFQRAMAYCVPYMLIACMPFAWYTVVQHHSGLHVAFTFRIVSVAELALGCIALGLFRLGRRSAGNGVVLFRD